MVLLASPISKCLLAALSQVLRSTTSFLTKQRDFIFFYSLILGHAKVENSFIARFPWTLLFFITFCTDTKKRKIKKEIRSHDIKFWLTRLLYLQNHPLPYQKIRIIQKVQNYNTPYSHVISHRSTDGAVSSLAAEIGRDPAFSASYGRSIPVSGLKGCRWLSLVYLVIHLQRRLSNDRWCVSNDKWCWMNAEVKIRTRIASYSNVKRVIDLFG